MFDPKRTKIIPELLSNKHQAQFYDADLGMWVDLGDAKDTRAEAQALIDIRIKEYNMDDNTCEAYNTVKQGMCGAQLTPLGDCPKAHEHGDHLADR